MKVYGSAPSRNRVWVVGWQWQQAPIIHLCLHFPVLNNNFAAKYVVAGHYLMIPVDKEAISTPPPSPKLWRWTGRTRSRSLSVIAEDTSRLTTSDYLSVRAWVVRRWTPLTASLQSGRVLVIFWRAPTGMSDFTGTSQREGGNGGN